MINCSLGSTLAKVYYRKFTKSLHQKLTVNYDSQKHFSWKFFSIILQMDKFTAMALLWGINCISLHTKDKFQKDRKQSFYFHISLSFFKEK